jgi:hypothetical protein
MVVRHHDVRVRLYLWQSLRRIASWRQDLCHTHVVEGRLPGRADWTGRKVFVREVFVRDLQTRRRCRDALDV